MVFLGPKYILYYYDAGTLLRTTPRIFLFVIKSMVSIWIQENGFIRGLNMQYTQTCGIWGAWSLGPGPVTAHMHSIFCLYVFHICLYVFHIFLHVFHILSIIFPHSGNHEIHIRSIFFHIYSILFEYFARKIWK